MCDTAVALGSATVNGATIFAKNSDRHPNECQPLFHAPRQSHPAGSTLRCQYLEVPQAAHTWEVIGCRPWWLWGFETGLNEWGVAIGNEAVFSKEPYEEIGLLGMDLVRLGLERGRMAHEALRVVVEHLERFGQGGQAGLYGRNLYHNSFIIADPREAWVLETAGRYWAAQRVRGARNISNVYSIETQWDEGSPDLIEHAVARGWCRGKRDFNFARAYGDWERPFATRNFRYQRGRELLARDAGRITVDSMLAYLRDHYDGTFAAPQWSPRDLLFPSLCLHGSSQTPSETASGLVAVLREGESPLRVAAWHCFSSPCLNAFHPVYLPGVGLPAELDRGGRTFAADSLWWLCERLQRRVDANAALAPVLQGVWRELEGGWREQAPRWESEAERQWAAGDADGARDTLRTAVDRCAEELAAAATRMVELLDQAEAQVGREIELQPEHRAALDADAGLPGATTSL